MTRTINASVITALAGDFTMVKLLRLGFQTGSPLADTMLTDASFDVTWSGDVYLSSSHILDIGSISETADLRVGTLNLTLSAVDTTYSTIFLTTDYIDVRVRYWRALLDSDSAIIGEPLMMFDGQISGYKLSESGSNSKLTIECASHWANFEIISGRKTNQTSQEALFGSPVDMGMEFAAKTIRDIKWGRG